MIPNGESCGRDYISQAKLFFCRVDLIKLSILDIVETQSNTARDELFVFCVSMSLKLNSNSIKHKIITEQLLAS